jgi:hypothetical protein
MFNRTEVKDGRVISSRALSVTHLTQASIQYWSLGRRVRYAQNALRECMHASKHSLNAMRCDAGETYSKLSNSITSRGQITEKTERIPPRK